MASPHVRRRGATRKAHLVNDTRSSTDAAPAAAGLGTAAEQEAPASEGRMPSSTHAASSFASVVIPAHDEGPVIDRCLESLTRAAEEDGIDLDVIVVANGCTDDTAERASRHRAVTVIDLAEPSKRLALDVGDQRSRGFPRIFLDADICLAPGALADMVEALRTVDPRVAAPTVHFDVSGASQAVRAFYRAFEKLPYVQDNLVGLGVYGINKAGRARFDRFPEVIADDLFIQRLFAPHERVVVPARFDVMVPRDLRNLVKVRTRVARGNAQLAASAPADDRFDTTTNSTARALRDLVRRQPARVPDVALYVAVTLVARLRAKRSGGVWERDESSRSH